MSETQKKITSRLWTPVIQYKFFTFHHKCTSITTAEEVFCPSLHQVCKQKNSEIMNEPIRFVNKRRVNNRRSNSKEDGIEKDPKLPGCRSIDLDEILQFSAARQRALERISQKNYEPLLKGFAPNRVFINHVDSFNGKALANYLSEQTIVISKEEVIPEYEDEMPTEGLFDEEMFEAEEEKELKHGVKNILQNLEIVGTVDFRRTPNYRKPEGIIEILDEEKKEEFLTKLLTCGFIIYDITDTLSCHPRQIEEATWILNSIVNQLEDFQCQAPKLFAKFQECRTFILISTLMTWAKTKPVDPEDPNLPFMERDYRKRKPHPNYKVHWDFEKRVLEIGKKFPDKLRTIVIGSGITYGQEEDVLHFLFKMAWLNAPKLPLFKPGNNKIPLIHVDALADIVFQIIHDFPTEVRYIIAVELTSTLLKQIVKLIAKKLGTGKVVKVNKEEAFTFPEIKQRIYDMLTVNLNIIPGYILTDMELKTTSESTFEENVDAAIEEYRNSRNLKPIKIFIHGPPASGKSHLSRRLADYYKIHHLHAKEVIESGIQNLRNQIQELKDKGKQEANGQNDVLEESEDEVNDKEDDDDENEVKPGEDLESLTQFLNDIEQNMASNERHRLDEHFVLRLFKKRMLSNHCQNQGYIIDGYPKTIEDTRILYEPDNEMGELDEEGVKVNDVSRLYNKKIMPEHVISLDASDEFLIERVIKMPHKIVQKSHYEEEEMCRRLIEFRALNTEDNTPLIFYDELEIYPIIYNIHPKNDDEELNFTFKHIVDRIGKPKNYETTVNEEKRQQEKERLNEKYLEQLKMKSRQMIQERREKMENWMFLKNQEKEMEEKALAIVSLPLRHYLMKYIFPTLTRGLVEVARIRPSDPVDYLAEFLFKENPEGKMFHPNYDNLEDELAGAMEEYELSADGRDKYSDDVKQFSIDDSVIPDAVSNVSDVRAKEMIESDETSLNRTSDPKKMTQIFEKTSVDGSSDGSCVCPPDTARKTTLAKSSSSSSSSTPPAPPSVCTCPPYSQYDSSECSSSTSTSEDSQKSRSREPTASCKCPH